MKSILSFRVAVSSYGKSQGNFKKIIRACYDLILNLCTWVTKLICGFFFFPFALKK